jgi:hypothetical protein
MYGQNSLMDTYQNIHYQVPEATASYYSSNHYSESSDALSNQSSPAHSSGNPHEYQACTYYGDVDMTEEPLNDSTNCAPAVNRGGRKQIKVGTTKRNARERNRVRYINNCFEVLREHIPFEIVDETHDDKNRKLSKVETLRYAAIYIQQLSELLQSTEPGYDRETVIEANHTKLTKVKSELITGVKKSYSKKKNTPCNITKLNLTNNSTSFMYNNINISIYENRVANSSSPVYSSTSPCSTSSSVSVDSRYIPCELSPNTVQHNSPFINCSKAYDSSFYNAPSYASQFSSYGINNRHVGCGQW